MKTFLSSTYVDLVRHREAAKEAIESLGQQVGQMEIFGARPNEPLEACLEEIDDCDLFVGIYAHRYGFVPAESDLSITETEFNHANNRSKPQFCFVVHEDHPWPPKMIEIEPGKSKLLSFMEKIGSALVIETFTTPKDLAYKIATSLGRYLTNSVPQPSLLSENEAFLAQLLSEITSLRAELKDQKKLLQQVNHISNILQPASGSNQTGNTLTEKLPLNFQGCWKDLITKSTVFARFLDNELFVPYCYGELSELSGVFFDFRRTAENVFFARFKWFYVPIEGFAYFERSGPDQAIGGWWHSSDVPQKALEDLEHFDPNLPRMNELKLVRLPEPKRLPTWAKDFFDKSHDERLKQL